ncbi:MAG: hypothetical protein R3272_12465, partial [Candidatus Promineifilaceae bacterium]|nr:hypothetical protein [Candidatus Promineifilaceae bacterium]
MPTLHLAFLGPPLVTAGVPDAGAEPLTFATRKSLALLIYLVAESGASGSVAAGARAAPEPMHRREKLAALLWPESDSSRSRANLRSALNYLRAALPETPDGATPHLHIERDRLGFNPTAPHTLDLALVQQALASRDPDEMAAAAAHGRGSFAAGFSPGDAPPFDAWIAAQRALWEQRVDLLFDRLSQAQFEQGQVAEAQATL